MTKDKKNSGRHCCPKMNNYSDIENTKYKFIEYTSYMRDYNVQLFDLDETKSAWRQALYYCPWCGDKLPKTLEKERAEILKEEYGLTDDEISEGSKVPEDFKTDKWWKDRGL